MRVHAQVIHVNTQMHAHAHMHTFTYTKTKACTHTQRHLQRQTHTYTHTYNTPATQHSHMPDTCDSLAGEVAARVACFCSFAKRSASSCFAAACCASSACGRASTLCSITDTHRCEQRFTTTLST